MRGFVLGVLGLAALTAAAGCSKSGGWVSQSDRDPMTDKVNPTLLLNATEGDAGLELVVQCLDGTSRVALFRNNTLTAENAALTEIRVDHNPPTSSLWNALIGNKGLAFTGGTDGLIRAIAGSQEVVVRVQSIDQGLIDATFKTAGLLDAMRPFSSACNWNDFVSPAAPAGLTPAQPPASPTSPPPGSVEPPQSPARGDAESQTWPAGTADQAGTPGDRPEAPPQ